MTTFAWDSVRGTLRDLQNVSTLREGWQGSRWSAQVIAEPLCIQFAPRVG